MTRLDEILAWLGSLDVGSAVRIAPAVARYPGDYTGLARWAGMTGTVVEHHLVGVELVFPDSDSDMRVFACPDQILPPDLPDEED